MTITPVVLVASICTATKTTCHPWSPKGTYPSLTPQQSIQLGEVVLSQKALCGSSSNYNIELPHIDGICTPSNDWRVKFNFDGTYTIVLDNGRYFTIKSSELTGQPQDDDDMVDFDYYEQWQFEVTQTGVL